MKSIAGLWSEYRDTPVVDRAEHYAKYTIPSLMVDSLERVGAEQQSVRHDFQSVGSLLINNLSAKLTTLLFPSNQPFFKVVIGKELKSAADKRGVSSTALASQLSLVEQEATKNLFTNASFAKLIKTIKLLLVTGQALLYRDPTTKKVRIWSIRNFAVRRNSNGEWVCIVLKQRMAFADLTTEQQKDARAVRKGAYKPETVIELFTKIERKVRKLNDIVEVTEELDGNIIGGVSTYPVHLSPWVLPVWNLADGEHYARGLVEEYAGDFAKLSILSEQLGLYELDSLQVLNLVDEGSGSSVDDFQNAEGGDYIPGKKDSVTAHESGDYQKMATVRGSIGEVTSRLSIAFMYSGNTRDAERVTAEEIQQQAKEAENMLGGAYSVLAETLQTPMAYLTMQDVSRDIIVGLISKAFYPEIVTGIPALNRGVESQNFMTAVAELGAIVPNLAAIDARLDPAKVADMIYRNRSVDTTAVFKSEGDLRKEATDAANQLQAVTNAQAGAAPSPLQEML